MPKARDPARGQARDMWLASGKTAKLRDIAKNLGVPEKTVSAWKSKDAWNKETERSTPEKDRSTQKKKRGGQPGNKNATGAPPGSQRGLVTGAYASVFFDDLTEEERNLLQVINADTRQALQHQLNTLIIREHRMLMKISMLREGEAMITREHSVLSKPSDKKKADGTNATTVTSMRLDKEATDERILRFEQALTGVQAELRRGIDSMRQLYEQEGKIVTEIEDLTPLVELLRDDTEGTYG